MDFGEFARRSDSEMDPVEGALLIARDAYPRLDLEQERQRLRALSEPLRGRGLEATSAVEQALAVSDLLYRREGFRGNVDDYYDPKNSYLNEVLSRRIGIPISLALVYCDVARRLGVPAAGVSFPGHFLVRIEGAQPVFVDPFEAGRLLDREGITRLWERTEGLVAPVDERFLVPASPRAILTRMLVNLRGAHAMRGDLGALVTVLDRALELVPDSPPELRDRGLVSLRLGSKEAALADLERYLAVAAGAGDVAEIRRVVAKLSESRRWLN